MNLTWLDDFLALAASGNFSRAADERHMTQPAFSRRRMVSWHRRDPAGPRGALAARGPSRGRRPIGHPATGSHPCVELHLLARMAARAGTPHPIGAHATDVRRARPLRGLAGTRPGAVHGASLRKLGVHTVFTAHLASVLKTMAMEGRGMAWVPASLVTDELAQGQLVPAGGARWAVPLDVRLYRDPAPLSVAAEGFWVAVNRSAR